MSDGLKTPILTFDNFQLSEARKSEIDFTNQPKNLQSISQNERIANFVNASISDNTRKCYQNDLAHFLKTGGRIPSTPEQVANYLAIHADKLTAVTLARRLVAISRAHTSQNLPSPTSADLVKATLRGIRRTYSVKQRQVKPIVKGVLFDLVQNVDSLKGIRDKALLLIGFAGAFRRSELVSLRVEDITFVEQGITIYLARSKTDQEGEGRTVAIPFARGNICPVLALKSWLEGAAITSGAIFRGINRHGKISGKQLSTEAVALIIKNNIQRIGLDAKTFSGHSLRSGLVTSAAQAGVSNWIIKAQTGHRSDAMLNRYVRDARIFIDNAAGAIL